MTLLSKSKDFLQLVHRNLFIQILPYATSIQHQTFYHIKCAFTFHFFLKDNVVFFFFPK